MPRRNNKQNTQTSKFVQNALHDDKKNNGPSMKPLNNSSSNENGTIKQHKISIFKSSKSKENNNNTNKSTIFKSYKFKENNNNDKLIKTNNDQPILVNTINSFGVKGEETIIKNSFQDSVNNNIRESYFKIINNDDIISGSRNNDYRNGNNLSQSIMPEFDENKYSKKKQETDNNMINMEETLNNINSDMNVNNNETRSDDINLLKKTLRIIMKHNDKKNGNILDVDRQIGYLNDDMEALKNKLNTELECFDKDIETKKNSALDKWKKIELVGEE